MPGRQAGQEAPAGVAMQIDPRSAISDQRSAISAAVWRVSGHTSTTESNCREWVTAVRFADACEAQQASQEALLSLRYHRFGALTV
jgi:hypothetical protein